jgi:hypothetical protein
VPKPLPPGKKGRTTAKTENLLRRLAATAKKDTVRLRAIELLLMLEGKLSLNPSPKPSKDKEVNALTNLIHSQPSQSKPFDPTSLTYPLGTLETELLSAAR